MTTKFTPTPQEIEAAARAAVADLYDAVEATGGKVTVLRDGAPVELTPEEAKRLGLAQAKPRKLQVA